RRNLRARKAVRRRVVGGVVPTAGEIGAQGAPRRLLAHVHRNNRAGARRQLIASTGELGVLTIGEGRKRRTGIGIPLRPQQSAHLNAGLRARNVVIALAVEATDFSKSVAVLLAPLLA